METATSITVGTEKFSAALSDERSPETVARILSALPFSAPAKVWGEEIYFEIPVEAPEENGVTTLSVGDLAYWPSGNCFCIFFGRTPMSPSDDEIVPASAVNLIGTIEDPEKLKTHAAGEMVTVARADD